MDREPNVKVGIMSERSVEFVLSGMYEIEGKMITGRHCAINEDGMVVLDGVAAGGEVEMRPADWENCSFELVGVTIGVNFHWERKENQRFRGALKLICRDGAVTAINVLPVEDYLQSVISSEMSATSSLELLKAHAVISRSWLLAQIYKENGKDGNAVAGESDAAGCDEMIKWYDREDHVDFDVCADDHCQRYQGITRETTAAVRDAVEATGGQVLMYDGQLCDARFSKCCGGVYEQFENCWEPVHHPYLVACRDDEDEADFPDLTKEEAAADWIMSSPRAFCNTTDENVLRQVLNNYDQETADFYRWRVEYSQDELAELIARRSGIDFGRILDLRPVARGTSGRLYKLKIVGEKRTLTIGKELEIRRTLSPSHLYSSAFIVERHDIAADGYPGKFVLRGAGWGHGVGLCQIGAAVMGEKGYSYKQILMHYFKGAAITKLYETKLTI